MMKCRKRALLSLVFAVIFVVFRLLLWLSRSSDPIQQDVYDQFVLPITGLPVKVTENKNTKTRPRVRVSKDILDDVNEDESSFPVPREGRILTIIVPHSHTDPGRLYTVQDYYEKRVRRILNLAVSKLTTRSDMTFIWSETVFLYMWWKDADSVKRSMLKTLVHDGRFEIVAGGWVMADAAVTHYSALLVQIQVAHEWLSTEFQVSPKAAWAIDSFGHSPTLPYLWSQTGYTFAVAQRVSQKYKHAMGSRRQLEFTWRQQWDKTGNTDFFCHVPPYKLYNIADACGPDPSVCMLLDFKTTPVDFTHVRRREGTDSTLDRLISSIVHQLRQKAANFNHNVVLLPLGDDFRYDTELEWDTVYANLDILTTYINNNPKFNMMIKYGTLKDYLTEVRKQYNTSRSPLYSGDFLPYTDNSNDYWTGFYSSRPEQKRAIRELQETYHVASVWYSLLLIADSHKSRDDLEHVARTLSLLQHHDAITGTSKSTVVGDYRSRAREHRDMAREVICYSVQRIIGSKSDQKSSENGESIWKFYGLSWDRPQLLTFSARKVWHLVAVNSLPQTRNDIISLVLDINNVIVTNNYGTRVSVQVNPFRESHQRLSRLLYVIQFPIFIESMSFAVYTISRAPTDSSPSPNTNIAIYNNHLKVMPSNVFNLTDGKQDPRLSNSYITAVFSPLNGSLIYVYLKESDTKIAVSSELLVYNSSTKSGAYIFAPLGDAHSIFSSSPSIFTTSGEISQQIEITYTGVTLTYTLYNTDGVNAKVIHVTCHVNVNMTEMRDLELIVRFVTNINSSGILYTDNNGFQHSRRTYRKDTPIAGNYYPITTNAVIQDNSARFTVHATHAHGVASLRDGELEIMLDRHPMSDDGKGLGQGMKYSNSHVDTFSLQFEKCDNNMCQPNEMFLPTLNSIVANDYLQCPMITILSNSQYELKTVRLLSEKLPIDTTIVTMRKKMISSNQFTLQMVLHRRGSVESRNTRAQPINLWSLVREMYAVNVKEMSLTFTHTKRALSSGDQVTLEPMTMAAFEIGLLTV
ncbi:alpha-mannosidase 2x-like [Pecten maximus]|uniref:alpha-mannosidase 2x-like n=1 Tax=Pecten maximus TaxID=6579 RepID=UPI0014584BDC|nr:alpha-mannosidase 2x-like [Pecten maximus]